MFLGSVDHSKSLRRKSSYSRFPFLFIKSSRPHNWEIRFRLDHFWPTLTGTDLRNHCMTSLRLPALRLPSPTCKPSPLRPRLSPSRPWTNARRSRLGQKLEQPASNSVRSHDLARFASIWSIIPRWQPVLPSANRDVTVEGHIVFCFLFFFTKLENEFTRLSVPRRSGCLLHRREDAHRDHGA